MNIKKVTNGVKKFFKTWVTPEESPAKTEQETGIIRIETTKLIFEANFDDEKSMKLARKIIDDVISSRYGRTGVFEDFIGKTD